MSAFRGAHRYARPCLEVVHEEAENVFVARRPRVEAKVEGGEAGGGEGAPAEEVPPTEDSYMCVPLPLIFIGQSIVCRPVGC